MRRNGQATGRVLNFMKHACIPILRAHDILKIYVMRGGCAFDDRNYFDNKTVVMADTLYHAGGVGFRIVRSVE